MTAHAEPQDLIGIGFGPSNLALAIALRELAPGWGQRPRTLFLDRQDDYRWHGNTLVNQSELQISFLKDLVTLRNPTSPFSFVNYLREQGRLVDFINLGTFYPCRLEFNDYLRWVASHFEDQAAYGQTVVAVEPVSGAQGVDVLRVRAHDDQGRENANLTRALVLSTGGTPRFPNSSPCTSIPGCSTTPTTWRAWPTSPAPATSPCASPSSVVARAPPRPSSTSTTATPRYRST